ncbi:hypothetical protein TrVFT333_002113 [Trichoderma virens FT-333]|nr:hypothetical protein TrVFT333_002113 [Trichoderma virens FT-333]
MAISLTGNISYMDRAHASCARFLHYGGTNDAATSSSPSKPPVKDFLAATSTSLVLLRQTNKCIGRSQSPDLNRFAQLPFTDSLGTLLVAQFSINDSNDKGLDHFKSVAKPSVGKESL